MKTKKIIALTLSAAMAIGTAAMLAACKPTDDGGNYVEDTTVYHCAGQSNGTDGSLYNQGWDQTSAGATEKVTFVKDETQKNKNVFTLEMKLYAGDQFKIVHDESWAGELTTYYFTNAEEDSTYNYVAKTDGEVVFRDYSSSSSNITLNEGHDGIYKFTLETDPSATEAKDMYKISYELVEAIPRLQIPYDMKVLGDFNLFGRYDGGEMNSSNGVWSTIIEITEEDLTRDETGATVETGALYSAVYVANLGDGEKEGDPMEYVSAEEKKATIKVGGDDTEVNLLPEGKWTVSFDEKTGAVTIEEVAYEIYFIGDFCGWETDKGYETFPLTSNSDGTIWTGTLTLTKASAVKLFNALGTGNKYLPGSMSGNYSLEAGKYIFKYDTTTDTVEYEEWAWYIVGNYTDPTWSFNADIKDDCAKLELKEGTIYEGEVTFTAAAEVKAALCNSLDSAGIDWESNKGANQNVEAGTYIVTYDTSDGSYKFTPKTAE